MTLWSKIEPIWLKFKKELTANHNGSKTPVNHLTLKQKESYSKAKLECLVRDFIEVRKLSFTDTVIELGVSPTTVYRVCRTLKIGRYSDQIPSELRSNSSQEPYGWKSNSGVLEKSPVEWRCVELMFKLLQEGFSLHKIAAELALRGIPTKNGGKWFAKTISQILKFNEKFLSNQPKTDRRIK